jgi:ADP-ribosylglycohydrolase
MDAIAAAHVEALRFAIGGWGKSTTEAVQRIAGGVHWSSSGKTTQKKRGTGNGVPMKNSPLAAWAGSPEGGVRWFQDPAFRFNQRLVDFSAMTHGTVISAEASVLHASVMNFLLFGEPVANQLARPFLDLVADVVWGWQNDRDNPGYWHTALLEQCERTLRERMVRLARLWSEGKLATLSIDELKAEFGGGTCEVYNSLPFSYALSLRDPTTFGPVLDAVNAGGDNDTNAKLVGEMLGALHGLDFFLTPEYSWTVEGLKDYESLLALADRFCDTFGIETGGRPPSPSAELGM